MKKCIYIFLSLVLFLLSACSNPVVESENANPTDIPAITQEKPEETGSSEKEITSSTSVDYAYYKDLNEMAGNHEYIILGKVKSGEIHQLNIYKHSSIYGYGGSKEDMRNVGSFEVEILEVYKGKVAPGDTVFMDLEGGEYGGIDETLSFAPLFEVGREYFLFYDDRTELYKNAPNAPGRDKPYYVYMPGVPYLGCHRIVDGKISSDGIDENGKNIDGQFIKNGMTVDEVRIMIEEAVKHPPKKSPMD